MKLCYIKWRDAVAEEANSPLNTINDRLATLEEVGFYAGETEDTVSIVMEKETVNGSICPGRWRLHVPKSGIVEMKVVEFDKAFAKPRAARTSTKKGRPGVSLPVKGIDIVPGAYDAPAQLLKEAE